MSDVDRIARTKRRASRLGVIRIGVIADTHGLLREAALEALQGCGLIVHAGDIGKPTVLEGLRPLAPVVAIRGNVDREWAWNLQDTETFALCGRRIHVLHNLRDLCTDPVAMKIDIVISGHSHIPKIERREEVLYLNPGSAGPRRFKLPVTLATIALSPSRIRPRIVELQI